MQEALAKQAELAVRPLEWHLIGHLQSNKAREAARDFDWVQTVDRSKLVDALARHRPDRLPPLNVLLQVNIDDEASKHGCRPGDVQALAEAVAAEPRLGLRGLMAIPEPTDDVAAQHAAFARLRQLRDELALNLDTLSMGMSHDLEAAIAEGATWVRIGTALFGARDYGQPTH